MAGTVTVTESQIRDIPIDKIKWSWTSDSSGNADLVTTLPYYGQVIALVTTPAGGGSAPSDEYDITITDAEGYDVLQGAGVDRSNASTQTVVPTATSVAHGTLTLNVSNAGSGKGGTAVLYIKKI